MEDGTMWDAFKKVLVFVLTVGLTVSSPALSHARAASAPSSVAPSHEHHVVLHYADLAIDPADDGCPRAAPRGTHHQDDELLLGLSRGEPNPNCARSHCDNVWSS